MSNCKAKHTVSAHRDEKHAQETPPDRRCVTN